MKNNSNEDLITEVYQELNKDSDKVITKNLINDVIFNGQNKFTAKVIKDGNFEDIMLKYFGKFKARHHVIQKRYSKKIIKNK